MDVPTAPRTDPIERSYLDLSERSCRVYLRDTSPIICYPFPSYLLTFAY